MILSSKMGACSYFGRSPPPHFAPPREATVKKIFLGTSRNLDFFDFFAKNGENGRSWVRIPANSAEILWAWCLHIPALFFFLFKPSPTPPHPASYPLRLLRRILVFRVWVASAAVLTAGYCRFPSIPTFEGTEGCTAWKSSSGKGAGAGLSKVQEKH